MISRCQSEPLSEGDARFAFNPFEVAVCGYSGSGKTTLCEGLLKIWSQDQRVGYLKHDAHGVVMDRPGKDTARARAAGAAGALINDDAHFAWLESGELDRYRAPRLLLDYDVVLVEGYKQSTLPKLVVVDAEAQILRDFPAGLAPVLAYVGRSEQRPQSLPQDAPWFSRDDVAGISALVQSFFADRQARAPLCGLVLVGGRSTRMKQDKALLSYHQRPQFEEACDRLQAHCDQVFISMRADQALPLPPAVGRVDDTFIGFGPLGGILSAQKARPGAAWLVLACDLPFVTDDTLAHLIANRNPQRHATAYLSAHDGMPEPLCAIYEAKSRFALLHFLGLGYHCPRKVLLNSPIASLTLPDARALDNINTPAELAAARDALGSGRRTYA